MSAGARGRGRTSKKLDIYNGERYRYEVADDEHVIVSRYIDDEFDQKVVPKEEFTTFFLLAFALTAHSVQGQGRLRGRPDGCAHSLGCSRWRVAATSQLGAVAAASGWRTPHAAHWRALSLHSQPAGRPPAPDCNLRADAAHCGRHALR